MKIAGFQRTTLIDYPGRIASVIFLDRCNFRCGFCHNKELVTDIDFSSFLELDSVLELLERRKHLVDSVVITGGEPCLNSGIIDLAEELKKRLFHVKLDTNGTFPKILEKLIGRNYVDFIAMDIKSAIKKNRYVEAAAVNVDIDKLSDSINLIKNSGLDYEFRTTLVPGIVTENDLLLIGEYLKGSKKYVIQQFNKGDVIDPSFNDFFLYTPEQIKKFARKLKPYFDEVEIRGL
ncbi:MAG: anaerobic ribonucleoside-triphosphate reductase activating protein [Candidatus Woesearchaeota archaeon]